MNSAPYPRSQCEYDTACSVSFPPRNPGGCAASSCVSPRAVRLGLHPPSLSPISSSPTCHPDKKKQQARAKKQRGEFFNGFSGLRICRQPRPPTTVQRRPISLRYDDLGYKRPKQDVVSQSGHPLSTFFPPLPLTLNPQRGNPVTLPINPHAIAPPAPERALDDDPQPFFLPRTLRD